ncbi:restriction endonuclease subunit S [Pseudoflavonifractor phocaeensis]|uniref:restriction endonuclease subunit S n=1 Tax=Pseudoflavonifractor phocaeensis TaxID=1870988 RepID=UPI001FAFA51D|nr:restriction endonuclease subunit S [Pseudoflavonifractor phocaeensis]
MARLGDVIEQIRGVSYKPSDLHDNLSDNSVILLRANNIQNGEIVLDDVIYVSKSKVSESQYLRRGDILVCTSSGSKELVGKAAFVDEDLPMVFGAFCKVVRPKIECCKYMGHFFQSPYYRNHISAASAGANINNLRNEHIADLSIPLPSLDEQRKIAAVLDKVSDLIAKRRQQLDKLDLLIKSRFVEIFGDPISNTLGWEQVMLREATSKIGSGATPRGGKESYQTEGITLIRSMNVHDGRFEYKDLAHITDIQAAQLDNVIVEENDVFINITGASVARSCIVPCEVLPARVNQHVAIIRCIPNLLQPVFANCMFLNDRFKRKLLDIGESGGATRQAITKQQLEALTVILPPLGLQQQFAAFVERTEKTKTTISRSLEKLETLKKALMQEYFQ